MDEVSIQSTLAAESSYGMIMANLREHIAEFKTWVMSEGKSAGTADQYGVLVGSMYKHGDIRAQDIYHGILGKYAPGTYPQRNTARSAYLRFMGLEVAPRAPLNTPLNQQRARWSRLRATFASTVAQIMELKDADLVRIPDLHELLDGAIQDYRLSALRTAEVTGKIHVLTPAETKQLGMPEVEPDLVIESAPTGELLDEIIASSGSVSYIEDSEEDEDDQEDIGTTLRKIRALLGDEE
jgi:hypothetical protein